MQKRGDNIDIAVFHRPKLKSSQFNNDRYKRQTHSYPKMQEPISPISFHKRIKFFKFLSVFLILSDSLGCGLELPSPPPDIFYKHNELKVGRGPSYLITVDLNLDGLPDLVSANSKNNTLSVLLSNGDGTFRKTLTFPVASEPTSIATGDVNRDSIPDLLVNSRGSGQFTILLGYGNGSFRKLPAVKTGKVPLAIIPADFNGDKKLDVAVTLTFDKMEIYLGSGDGTFNKKGTYLTGSRPFSGASGDFNRDGNIDIALATSSSASSAIRLYMGKGNGAFFMPRVIAKGLVPLALVKSDMNSNGLEDLIFTSGKGDNIHMLLSRGDGTFKKEITLSGGGGPIALTVGHFNSDNKIDIAVANSRSSNFSLVMRVTNELFHYPTRDYIVNGGTPLGITSGDYNNDSMTDIAVASNAKNTIEIYLQRKVFR
jgi:hypothetical protein